MVLTMKKVKIKPIDILIGEIIDTISLDFTGIEITDQGSGKWKITTKETLWLTINQKVLINDISFTVTDVVQDEYVILKGSEEPGELNFTIPKPFYFHGSPMSTSNEIINLPANAKMPFIYFYEPYEEEFDRDPLNTIGINATCEMYFMSETNFSDWNQEQHKQYAVYPMRKLALAFIEAVENSKMIEQETYLENKPTLKPRTKWGKFYYEGNKSKLFAENISGQELRITLPFLKQYCCCNE